MATKSKQETPIQKSELLVPRESIADELRERIEFGRQLLDMQVTLIGGSPQGYGGFYNTRRSKMIYNEAEQKQFSDAFHKWNDYNCELLKQRFSKSNNEYHASYVPCGQPLLLTSSSDTVELKRKEISKKITNLESLIEKLPLIPLAQTADIKAAGTVDKAIKTINDSKKIFIVHGHDTTIRLEVETLLKDLGYEPIVLFKQPDKGQTIIEKLESEANDICFAVVIYSHCDDGKAVEETALKPRARQNVVFEHGMMYALLGRSRVVALLEEGVEQPGDLSGVIYKSLDAGGAWKYALARELKAAGLTIDLNRIG